MSKRQTAEGQCDKCYARILWVTNSATRGRLPLDIKAEKVTAASVGPFYLLGDEFEMIASRAAADVVARAIAEGRKLYTNHLATCEKRKKALTTEDTEEQNGN